jgi:hypothetical protein
MSTVIVGNEPITTASCAICSFFYYFEPDFYSEMYNPISHLLVLILVPFICVTKRLPWSLTESDFFYYGKNLKWQKISISKWDIFVIQYENYTMGVKNFTFANEHFLPFQVLPK